MSTIDIHRAWAPADATWSPWVKPVLFASLDRDLGDLGMAPAAPEWLGPELVTPLEETLPRPVDPYREDRSLDDVALVIDLPGASGIELGVALARRGFRPIPLYNALPSRVAIVDVLPMMRVLLRSADEVAAVPRSAPPAFLLDADRMGKGRRLAPGLFDNRSICRISDFPSAARLREAGIRRGVLVTEALEEDLEEVALAWQAGGLEVWTKRPSERAVAAPAVLHRPWIGRRLWKLAFPLLFPVDASGAYGRLIDEPAAG